MNNTFNESDNFTPHHVAVLVEELRSEFRVFGEGLGILNHKFEGMRVNQARTLEGITDLGLRMDTRFDSVETRLERLEAAKT